MLSAPLLIAPTCAGPVRRRSTSCHSELIRSTRTRWGCRPSRSRATPADRVRPAAANGDRRSPFTTRRMYRRRSHHARTGPAAGARIHAAGCLAAHRHREPPADPGHIGGLARHEHIGLSRSTPGAIRAEQASGAGHQRSIAAPECGRPARPLAGTPGAGQLVRPTFSNDSRRVPTGLGGAAGPAGWTAMPVSHRASQSVA